MCVGASPLGHRRRLPGARAELPRQREERGCRSDGDREDPPDGELIGDRECRDDV